MAWVDFDHWSKSTTPENVYQSNITINFMKIVNQDLWLGIFDLVMALGHSLA